MARSYKKKRKASPTLRQIGNWATWWWGISGLWVVWLVWESLSYYAANPDWPNALSLAFMNSLYLQIVINIILAGWIAGGYAWFRELKRQNISRKAALKDLFLTIRK